MAKASDIAGLTVLDRDGNVRPMVDMQGRLFRLEDMDPAFVKDFVNVDIYKEFAGRYVKNAYDDTLTDQDETLDVTIALLLKGEGRASRSRTRALLSPLLAYGQARTLLPAG